MGTLRLASVQPLLKHVALLFGKYRVHAKTSRAMALLVAVVKWDSRKENLQWRRSPLGKCVACTNDHIRTQIFTLEGNKSQCEARVSSNASQCFCAVRIVTGLRNCMNGDAS